MASKTSAVRPGRQTLTTEQVLELLELEQTIKSDKEQPCADQVDLDLAG